MTPTEQKPFPPERVWIRSASRDRFDRMLHPGARYVVCLTGAGVVHTRTLAEAKKVAVERMGGVAVRWERRTYLNGRDMAVEYMPIPKAAKP